MTKSPTPPEEGAGLDLLKREYAAAQEHMKDILWKYGVDSPEFREADKASGDLWARIKALQRKPGQDWWA